MTLSPDADEQVTILVSRIQLDADGIQFQLGLQVYSHISKICGGRPGALDSTIAGQVVENKKANGQKIHLVFSTSCSYKQDWQSYVFFYQAMSSRQQGDVTRLVSGCEPEQQEELQRMHKEQIQIMSDRFHLHFTPEYGGKDNPKLWQSTKYWNKPFGMRHWLENSMGFPNDSTHESDIVILVDPDMLLMEPFVNEFSNEPLDVWTAYFQNHQDNLISEVTHGHPIAQDYAFGDSWFVAASSNLTHVVGADSPVHRISKFDRKTFYPAGPPYILTFRDMYRVVEKWCEFLPKLFDIYPKFMAEMYGYCLAAAHLDLRHQLGKGFMVSNVEMGPRGEGWFFLDTDRVSDPKTICAHPEHPLPYVPHLLHFCQRYSIGEFFISKYKTHHSILSCEMPLFEVPPADAAATMEYSHFGDGSITSYVQRTRHIQHRNAFMACALMKSLNQAAIFYKRHHCQHTVANYNTTWNFFRNEAEKNGKKRQTTG